MMDAISRQDFVNVTEIAKNKIIERLVTKYDVQRATDGARDRILVSLQALHSENQAQIRQANAGRDQMLRRLTAIESQMAVLQQEIRQLNATLLGITDRREQLLNQSTHQF